MPMSTKIHRMESCIDNIDCIVYNIHDRTHFPLALRMPALPLSPYLSLHLNTYSFHTIIITHGKRTSEHVHTGIHFAASGGLPLL